MFFDIFDQINMVTFVFLGIGCFVAAFIDAIAGGGGLISLPAYLAAGIPMHVALGTNKVSAFLGTAASGIKFAKMGKVNWTLIKKIVLFSFIGAFLGVKTVERINPKYLQPIIIILLFIVLIYTLLNKRIGEVNEFEKLTPKIVLQSSILALVMGFYDGFFGPGVGSFLIFGLIRICKLDFTNASGNAKILNLASNVMSATLFICSGNVNYFYALSMAFVMIIGGITGSKVAVTKGVKFIKPMFLTITLTILIKLILEYIF